MKMTIGTKVSSVFMIGGLAPFIAIGFISYNTASTSLSEQAMNQLTSVREMKKTELEKYFTNRTSDIKTLASSTMTLNALEAFKAAFKDIGAEKARKAYILDNPHPPGKKVELMDAHDGSLYSAFHAKYHPLLKSYLKEYVYFCDLFLIDSETGDVVYTVFKEDDYGTNLYNGKYSKTNVGELARAVNASQDNTIKRVDFQFYEPSNGDPARFMASPILNEEGKRAGILILQFSIETIDNIMMVRAGLGETGEAYLVGPDKLMRSNSRFSKESTVLKQKVDTAAVQEALNNQAGTKVIKDYRGVSVISAYSPLKVGEMTWAIIAEIGEAEALKAAISLRNRMLIIGAGIAIGVVGLGYLATRRVTNLLKGLISELAESSSCVSSASQQTSASSQSLSQGTTEQAAAVEETSSSMEEMSSMTKQNADNAREASQLAVLCNKSAEEGNQSMFEMNSAMNEIDQSGKKIGEIIRTIDGIAFQTNLLALNAAVEAARAGEHGKGFAVVAEEVRNLAQRSAVAAKDTSSLIQESLRKTNGGTELAKKCTESFQNIVTNIKKMAGLVNEISAASQEQSQGVAQVSKAIQQIDQALQANAANAEEAASAGEELASQSHILNNLISRIANEVGGNGRVRSQESGVGSQRLKTQDSRLQTYLHNRINKQLFEEDEVPNTASKRGDNGGKG